MIVIPEMVMPAPLKERTGMPVCSRCQRETTERNLVQLGQRRSWTVRGYQVQYDIVCSECCEEMRKRGRAAL